MGVPRAFQSLCRILPSAGEDELTGATPGASINDNGIPFHTPVALCIQTLAPGLPLTPAELVAKYTNADLQSAIKLAIELFIQSQKQAKSQMAPQALEPQERPLKAWFLDLYYGNSHMDYYLFCQQCKDYFETARAKRPNRISFAALFLHGLVT